MPTQIGQYRYTGSGCVATEPSSIEYTGVSADVGSGDESSKRTFQDILIRPNSATFEKNQDYYLRINIPQDMNYNMDFTIKLIKKDGSSTSYQYIKDISVNRGGNADYSHNVALYKKKDGSVAAMIPLDYVVGKTAINGMLYYDKNNNVFYLGTPTGYERTTNVNMISLTESWRQETGTNYGVFELVFRPVEDGFNYILFEMKRLPEDYNIQRSTTDSGVMFGRAIDKDKVAWTLYRINSLTGYIGSDELERVGIWGHSGLMMAINGEEMRIGPSGFLEISGVTINSIGVVAPDNDYTNSFTIDYEYITSGGE